MGKKSFEEISRYRKFFKKFKNINTGVVLGDYSYERLLQREGEELWNNLGEDEKAKWSSKESFIEKYSMENTDFIEILKDEEYSIICVCDENDLVATLRKSFVEYNLGGEVINRESEDYILTDYEIDLDEFVKIYDEETGKFLYYEKELTEEEFDELKFEKIHEERALQGTRRQVNWANDILDSVETCYKDAKKVFPLVQRKKVKNEEQEAIKKTALDTLESVIKGAENILELKSAKEIINLYVDNDINGNPFKYLICCAKMASKDISKEQASIAFGVIHNINRYLVDLWR